MELTVDDKEYTINGRKYARVSRILEHCGLTDFSAIPPKDREYFMERGKQNHLAWEYVERGIADNYDFDIVVQQYLPAHARFLKETGFRALEDGIERAVWSDEHRVAGRLDRLGRFSDGRLVLLDYKTSSLVPATNIQTSIYAICLFPEYEFAAIDRYGVAFKKDGKYEMSPRYSFSDRREALAHIARYHKEVSDAH